MLHFSHTHTSIHSIVYQLSFLYCHSKLPRILRKVGNHYFLYSNRHSTVIHFVQWVCKLFDYKPSGWKQVIGLKTLVDCLFENYLLLDGEVRNSDMVELFFSGKNNTAIYCELVKKFSIEHLNKKAVFQKISKLRDMFKLRWSRSNAMRERFISKNKVWLSLPSFKVKSQPALPKKVGRPLKQFSESGRKTKKFKVRELTQKYSPEALGLAAGCSLSSKGFRKAAKFVENITSNPVLMKEVDTISDQPVLEDTLYTNDEALAFLCHNGFSKAQYTNIRLMSLHKGVKMIPAYNHVRDAKSKCYPEGNTTIYFFRGR